MTLLPGETAFTIPPHFVVCGGAPPVFTVGDRSSPVIAFKDAFDMKQSAARTLGVAALGAAFAAAGAGVAGAAPLPDAVGSLSSLPQAIPADAVADGLSGVGTKLSETGMDTAMKTAKGVTPGMQAPAQDSGRSAVPGTQGKAAPQSGQSDRSKGAKGADDALQSPAKPLGGLLGGLPVGGLKGLPVNGIPLGH